ncbi:MmgE/PrpD family protein [Pelagibacterium montanilacus]|uniref:MmgE/PrpD family protein n=1 Tax=Pelagibacterium montanilacus TaxID=2185280 RepID=UPI0013E03A27|nr:MmgE/PrpD family protein [Pelagibacterium montanilacus]
MTQTRAETLAAHFVSMRSRDLPETRIERAKVLLLDYLGVALGGSGTASGKVAAEFSARQGGRQGATIIGDGRRVPPMQAAFSNAIASHSIELDDVDILALFHFSPPVVSAALAVAEETGASGADLLKAIALGCEMMSRASHAANFSLRDRGFHTTPTCGVFGATVAAATLMDLDVDQMVSALGLAGAQASGLMEMYGPSMQKRFNPGPAARNGVTAAEMAKLGFTGAATIFEGERGFLAAFTDESDAEALTRNLGTDFPDEFEYKAYSCARPIHNAIDCALDVRSHLDEPLSNITHITMRRHSKWARYHDNKRPQTYHEAQVSLPYSVAVALIEGAALFPQYSNDKLSDPEIQRLSDLVEIVVDDSLPRGVSCLMEVTTSAGGSELSSQIDHPKGSIENPMNRDEHRAKVRLLAEPVVGAGGVQQLFDAVDALESAGSVSALVSAVVPGTQA